MEDQMQLHFRIRQTPEGWLTIFGGTAWGPFRERWMAEALANDMIDTLSREFDLQVENKMRIERPLKDKPLM